MTRTQINVALIVILTLALAVAAGYLVGTFNTTIIVQSVFVLGGAAAGIVILQRPYVGLALLIGIIPVTDAVSQIGIFSSIFPFVGAITVASYVMYQRFAKEKLPTYPLRIPLILATLWFLWAILVTPLDAVGNRNWMFTIVQLIILVWLMQQMMSEGKHQDLLILFFVIGTGFSALYLISNVGEISRLQTQEEILGGLSGGANEAARHYVAAIPFLYYLRNRYSKFLIATPLMVGLMLLFVIAASFTLSRTGFLLIGISLAMTFFMRNTVVKNGRLNLTPAIAVILLFSLLSRVGFSSFVEQQLLPSLSAEDATEDIRFALWRAGVVMWQDHPLQGVGFNQFRAQLPFYGEGRAEGQSLGAHNMYVSVLAELGIVGLSLFLALIAVSGWLLWQASRSDDPAASERAWAWLTVFIVLLVGGITKHDHTSKLLWACFGASLCFSPYVRKSVVSKIPARKFLQSFK